MSFFRTTKDDVPGAGLGVVLRFFLTRRGRWTLVALALLALVALYAPLLRAVGGLMVVARPIDAPSHVWVRGRPFEVEGVAAYDVAAAVLRDRPRLRVLLVDTEPTPTVTEGGVPSFVEMSRRELMRRGVPPDTIVVASDEARDVDDATFVLGRWLGEHPEARVVALCCAWDSRRLAWTLDRDLDPMLSDRVGIVLLPGDVDERADWWRSRESLKRFATVVLRFAVTVCRGSDRPAPCLSADEYERACRLRFGEAVHGDCPDFRGVESEDGTVPLGGQGEAPR